MKPVEFAPFARSDLFAIGEFIADDHPERALSFIAELEDRARTIGERPRSFPARDDISPGLRCALHGRYPILFRDLPAIVRIVRILHGTRDLPALARQGQLE